MPKSLNRATLIGNLGKDPELKYTPQGTPVATFSIATSSRYKDKQGEWQDKTEWHNITAWQRLAEICGQYLHKGSKVYIEGRIETQSWEKDGQKHYKTVIIAQELIMLSGKEEGESHASSSRSEPDYDQSRVSTRESGGPVSSTSPITDEDIPF